MHADEFTRHYQRAASIESAIKLQLRPCVELLVSLDV